MATVLAHVLAPPPSSGEGAGGRGPTTSVVLLQVVLLHQRDERRAGVVRVRVVARVPGGGAERLRRRDWSASLRRGRDLRIIGQRGDMDVEAQPILRLVGVGEGRG